MKTPICLFFLAVLPCVAQTTNAPTLPAPVATTTNAPAPTASPRPSIGQKISVTLTDGTVKAGRIVKIDPEGVTILTDDGGAKVLFSEMTPEDQKSWGYDSAAEAGFHKAQQAQAQTEKAAMARYRQKLARDQREEDAEKEWEVRQKSKIDIEGKVFQRTQDGLLLTRYHMVSPGAYEPMQDYPLIFIAGIVGEFSKDEVIKVYVFPDGNYTYTTTMGLQNSIPKFTIATKTGEGYAGDYEVLVPAGPQPPPPPSRVVFPAPDSGGN